MGIILRGKKKKRFWLVFSILVFWANLSWTRTESPISKEVLLESEWLNEVPLSSIRWSDLFLLGDQYYQSTDLIGQFIRFLFPISGREKRTMFLPVMYWGPKKPQHKIFDWNRFETNHFQFFSYPEGHRTLPFVVQYLEEDYERNNRMFGVENRFTKKIPIIYYQTRSDFEQTMIVSGPVPEGLGGVTELFSWHRVTFPFEGEMEKLEHVTKHEGTHIYQIAKGARHLPLWFIEGLAETNSIFWDGDAEMTIRDAFLNGFFFRIEDLWQIEGSWLMYKEGSFITNLLWKKYGEEGIRKIFEQSETLKFWDNLKTSLHLSIEELNQNVMAALSDQYKTLLDRKDVLDQAQKLKEKTILINSFGPFFLSGRMSGPRKIIEINHLSSNGKIVSKKIASDRRFKNESLGFFKKGASLNQDHIIYSIKASRNDEVRFFSYQFDPKKKNFSFGPVQSFSWPFIQSIENPVVIDENQIAFIGYENGFSNVYLFNHSVKHLEKITQDQKHYSGLDYSPVRRELVFSKEEGRAKDRIRYDRNLYTFHLDRRVFQPISQTPFLKEEEPRFSPDGKKILYVSDPEKTFDLFVYDFQHQVHQRLTQMRIGARHPHWGENQSILFNSFNRLIPMIYRVAFPSSRDLLNVELPKGTPVQTQLTNGMLQMTQAVEPPPSEIISNPRDEIVFDGEKPQIYFKKNSFWVRSVAPLQKSMVLKAEKTQSLENYRYFMLEGTQLRSLESTMVARSLIGEKERKKIEEEVQHRSLIASWTSQKGDEVLALVNNRLAKQADLFKKKPEVSLVLLDDQYRLEKELEEGPVQEISDQIQWVSFLPDGKIFMALGLKPEGPFVLLWYDRNQKKYTTLTSWAEQFRISHERDEILWGGDNKFFYQNIKNSQPQSLPKIQIKSSPLAFSYLEDGRISFFSVEGDKWKIQTLDSSKNQVQEAEIPHSKEERVLFGTLQPHNGNLVIQIEKNEPEPVGQILRQWKSRDKTAEMIFRTEGKISFLAFFQEALLFEEKPSLIEKTKEWVWVQDQLVSFSEIQEAKKFSSHSWIFNGPKTLFQYNFSQKKSEILAQENAGYAHMKDQSIVVSVPDGPYFQLVSYDLSSKSKKKKIKDKKNHLISPLVEDQKIYWLTQKEEEWNLVENSWPSLQKEKIYSLQGFDVGDPKIDGNRLWVKAYEKVREESKRPKLIKPDFIPQTLGGSRAVNSYRLQALTAAAAYDGSDFRFFISGFADNLFSDRGIFVDSVFLGDARFATVGYSDLRYGISYSAFYNSREEIKNYGLEFSRAFVLDRYREVSTYGVFEIQDYGFRTNETLSFVTSEIENQEFYLVKAGAIFAYDVTLWDNHGPINGSRVYFRLEAGMDTANARVSNLDANVDFRVYHELLPRFGFAHRLVAGTSQGNIPSVYLLGGNLSFRGISFDELEGQNYWAFSEDMRVPVFDFLGAKFFDPLDQFVGFLTRFFDIRSGMYFDVGSAWYNHEKTEEIQEKTVVIHQPMEVIHSFGYFVNAPTLFGINFRFNQGLVGKKGIGIWLGANW